jgi:hypothetical protein
MFNQVRKENVKKKRILTDVKNKSNSAVVKDTEDQALKNGMVTLN